MPSALILDFRIYSLPFAGLDIIASTQLLEIHYCISLPFPNPTNVDGKSECVCVCVCVCETEQLKEFALWSIRLLSPLSFFFQLLEYICFTMLC